MTINNMLNESPAQARVSSGDGLETIIYNNTNATKNQTKIKDISIDNRTLKSILMDNNTTLHGLNLASSNITFDFNDKHDAVVNGRDFMYKDKTLIKTLDNDVNFIEIKQKKGMTLKGMMLFEMAKVSTYSQAISVMNNIHPEALNGINTDLAKRNSDGMTDAEKNLRNTERKKIDDLLNTGNIGLEKEVVNAFLKKISIETVAKKVVAEAVKNSGVYLLVADRNQFDETTKKFKPGSIVVKNFSSIETDLKVAKWKGFGRLTGKVGSLNESEENLKLEINIEVSLETSALGSVRSQPIKTPELMVASVEDYLGGLLREINNV